MKAFFTLLLTFLLGSNVFAQNDFITRWNLATSGSGNTQLTFAVGTSGTVDYTWQEVSPGTASGLGTFTGNTATIGGLPAGAIIDLSILPANFTAISINNNSDKDRLLDVRQWGTATWSTMEAAFFGALTFRLVQRTFPIWVW